MVVGGGGVKYSVVIHYNPHGALHVKREWRGFRNRFHPGAGPSERQMYARLLLLSFISSP